MARRREGGIEGTNKLVIRWEFCGLLGPTEGNVICNIHLNLPLSDAAAHQGWK